ncbi:MAG TPA: glycine zipper 2TM domain-containing protein [Rhodoferax sp.]|nr:glycine zipper 2TM domain-containing protein [Rhodoferax sp.]
MKRIIFATVFASVLFGAQAETYTDSARVRSAEAQYENVNVPRNECSRHWVEERGGRSAYEPHVGQERQYGGAIVGGLAGGVIGHQIGAGTGKDAATALGVVLGAIAGDRIENEGRRPPYERPARTFSRREVESCRTVYDTQTRLTGYRVAYEYRGQTYTTFMRSNPGNSLPVRVSVDPIMQ